MVADLGGERAQVQPRKPPPMTPGADDDKIRVLGSVESWGSGWSEAGTGRQ